MILTAVETCVRPNAGPSLASPKSESFGLKFSSNKTLEALKSRKITYTIIIKIGKKQKVNNGNRNLNPGQDMCRPNEN